MSEITVGSEWIDDRDGDILKILVVDGIVLRVESKDEGLCTVLANDLLRNYRPKTKQDSEVADMVNNPPHYKDASGVGCTEVVKHMMYFGGACFKYLYRCGNKWDDVEDLKKAVRCAELADDDRFITDESWLRAMYQVASHRDGNIRDAMFAIRCQQWTDVIDCISAEIARLESE